MPRSLLLLALMLALPGCSPRRADGPIVVSVVGGTPEIVDPNRQQTDAVAEVLLGAVAQGLVAFDEAAQVRPALAQRWAVTDDGLSAIFRLDRLPGPDGKPVSAERVARRLRAIVAARSRNPLQPVLEAIDEVAVMTPEVIEIRLKSPRPPLLELLASPHAAMLWDRRGSGPFEIVERVRNRVTLRRRPDPVADPDAAESTGADVIRLRGERAALAIARFTARESDLVLGGSFRDWPLVRAARPRAEAIRLDPAEGLFGLAFERLDGFVAEPENRRALAMAIDRAALLAAFDAQRWSETIAVLPESFRSQAPPVLPPWESLTMSDRRESARARVATWRAFNEGEVRVRIALPEGPGSDLLFGLIRADWQRIGVVAERVEAGQADLALVDAVAPAASAIWYLATLACPTSRACAPEAVAALDRARASRTLEERGLHLAAADRAISDAALYIPIARPLRWSLVAPRLDLFRENPRAVHPLDRLRRAP